MKWGTSGHVGCRYRRGASSANFPRVLTIPNTDERCGDAFCAGRAPRYCGRYALSLYAREARVEGVPPGIVARHSCLGGSGRGSGGGGRYNGLRSDGGNIRYYHYFCTAYRGRVRYPSRREARGSYLPTVL